MHFSKRENTIFGNHYTGKECHGSRDRFTLVGNVASYMTKCSGEGIYFKTKSVENVAIT